MKLAWIEGGKVREICHGNPAELFVPEVARNFSAEVPDFAEPGDSWDGKELIKPIVVRPAVVAVKPAPKVPAPLEFREGEDGLRALFAYHLDIARTRQP